MTNNDPIFGPLAEQANKQLLKYAVSTQIFCPSKCGGQVMDMRRAVLVTVRTPDGKEEEYVMCVTCWEGYRANVEGLAKARGLTLTVLDGRELWKQPVRPAKATAKAKRPNILNLAIAAVEEGENVGICRSCGHSEDGYEPDARKRKCEACGEFQVFGAEELLIMLG